MTDCLSEEVEMKLDFNKCHLTPRPIKVNAKIKRAIDAYRKKKVPMRVLLTNFLAVKSKGDDLADAENPWAYFYKGIEGHEVESGVSVDETLFRFATMEIKDQNPTDVIIAAYYANKRRNDSAFEIGYLLPVFLNNVGPNSSLLIVNPSPDMIAVIESQHFGKHYYGVTDETVAGLYQLQFQDSVFVPFDHMDRINEIDAVLITNRDQPVEHAAALLKFLSCCKRDTFVAGLIPSSWFDQQNSEAYKTFKKAGYSAKEIVVVDTKATVSSPRKKMIAVFRREKHVSFSAYQSVYNIKEKIFQIQKEAVPVVATRYFETRKTILSCIKENSEEYEQNYSSRYKKAQEYRFSEEISLFYKVYEGRKNRYAGVAYYRELKDPDRKIWGKKVTPDIEKGLRSETVQGIMDSLEDLVFDEEVYPYIRSDIEKYYVRMDRPTTLKTIWFFCVPQIVTRYKYDGPYIRRLFQNLRLADCSPGSLSGSMLLGYIADSLKTDIEDIPLKAIEQINLILETAVKNQLLSYNTLEIYLQEYTRRATERQQDVRNALVKKHFSDTEESIIVKAIIEDKLVSGIRYSSCAVNSLLLSAAIRLFTGMAIREVAALAWRDFRAISASEQYQLTISRIVDAKGRLVAHSDRELWKRFRIVPVCGTLAALLEQRKSYLIKSGIDEDYLLDCPIVLAEERMSDMQKRKTVRHCPSAKISKVCSDLVLLARIPPMSVVLPDPSSDLTTDFNRYHGDIFLSNFRHKANHEAFLTLGEINYMIGIDAPDTFSRHYCDYTNDFVQISTIQKLKRWEGHYERSVRKKRLSKPKHGESLGKTELKAGPFAEGNAAVDLLIEATEDRGVLFTAEADHGMDIHVTEYQET